MQKEGRQAFFLLNTVGCIQEVSVEGEPSTRYQAFLNTNPMLVVDATRCIQNIIG